MAGLAPKVRCTLLFKKLKKNTYQIRYLSPTSNKFEGRTIFDYENTFYEISEDSITEHMNTDDEGVLGFRKNEYGFTKITEDDSDYEPSESSDGESSEEDEEDEEESLADSTEDVEDEYYSSD
jgi:hypothetical protein